MRLGIDGRTLGTSRALGRYLRNLLLGFSQFGEGFEFFLFLDKGSQEAWAYLGIEDDRWQVVEVPAKKLLRDHLLFADYATSRRLDLFFHPDNVEFWRMPLPSVVTVHDLMPYKFPELILSSNWSRRLWQKAYFRVIKGAIKTNSLGVITVSEHTKQDLVADFGLEEARVRVISEGVEESFLRAGREGVAPEKEEAILSKYGLEKEYLFYLGGLNRHKNVPFLVKAYAEATQRGLVADLVIGGQTSSDNSTSQNTFAELTQLVTELGVGERVKFPGFIAEEDLPIIYNQAQLFVFPSLYEGFGFPPLEAMACGCPVICSRAASLPEVVGEAGLLLDPQDTESWGKEIWQLASDSKRREDLRQRGLAQAAKFSWQRCAQATLAFFQEVVGR